MPTKLARLRLGAVARRRAGLATASPAAAQAPDDPAQLEPVVVTVTRMEQKAGNAPASVTVLPRDDMHDSGTQTVDDLLRQVPGFSLFRRSSSPVTHPTTPGVSLRGIGPSGTSRALVLFDGVPANDAFGGWVYWGRVPMLGVEQIEVVRGSGSACEADSNHSTFNGRVELLATPEASFFVSGFYYYEERSNGTPL